MKVIFEINGWKKVADVENIDIEKGFINIVLEPPITYLYKSSPANAVCYQVILKYWGQRKDGWHVFGYEG